MIRKLVLAAAVLALATVAVPRASADSFDLNVIYCNCIPSGSIGGTVAVTEVSANVADVLVTLNSGLAFHDQGQTSFSFNIVDPNLSSPLSSSAFTIINNGGSTWTFQQPAVNSDGAGSFLYGFECAAGSNHCAGVPTTFEFQVTDTGIGTHLAWLETTNSSASNVDFSANIARQDVSSCTGQVGGGNGTGASTPSGGAAGGTSCGGSLPVAEPTSVLLLGTALLLAGKLLKMKLLV